MPQELSRRTFLQLTSGAAIAAQLRCRSARAAAKHTAITIANASGSLNLTMAELIRQEKLLESVDLDPNILTVADGTRILGGVVSGSVDLSTMSGFGQVFPAIEHGARIKILGGGALLPVLAMFSAKPNVKVLKDLEGKTVGTGSIGALIYQLTANLLEKYGVDVSKVRFANIGSSADIFRAVAAGTVDAGAGDVALIDNAAEHHVHLIDHGNMSIELKEYTYQGAWTSDQKIATERESLVRALVAYGKLYRFVQNPDSKEAFFRARRSIFPNAPMSDHQGLWNYIQTYKPFAVNLALEPERLHYMQMLNIGFKVQKEVLPFERVADMSLAADAVKLIDAGTLK
jgi:ABC-type nitrate/sulfonate/bicarbonate transport system substrate-binding protein